MVWTRMPQNQPSKRGGLTPRFFPSFGAGPLSRKCTSTASSTAAATLPSVRNISVSDVRLGSL